MSNVSRARVCNIESRLAVKDDVPVIVVQGDKVVAAFSWNAWLDGREGMDTIDPELLERYQAGLDRKQENVSD